MQNPTNLLQEKESVRILVLGAFLVILIGLLWNYSVITPALANNPPSSVYDGVSPAGPVINPSPIPCTGGEDVLLIQDNVPWFAALNQNPLGANVTELIAQNKDFCIITSGEIGSTNLNQFPEIIISAAQVQSFYNNLFPGGIVHPKLVTYVQGGGILTANLTDNASGPGAGGNWDGKTFIGGLAHTNDFTQNNNNISLSSHPIIITGQFGGINGGQIVDITSLQDLDSWGLASHGFFTNLPVNTGVILVDSLNRPVMIEYPFGNGIVIASQITNEWRYVGNFGFLPQNKKLLANEIGYQDSLVVAPEQMIRPTVDGTIKRGFGICFNPETGKAHEGLDIDESIDGDEVFAAAGGTVVIADRTPEGSKAGKWIWIFHGDVARVDGVVVSEISTRYLHLASINPQLSEGDIVSQGDSLGFVDNTGIESPAPHLHFEVRQGIPIPSNFRLTTALNPEDFVEYPISPFAFSALVCSPVDLIVTDPDGLDVSKDINELPGLAEYFEVKYQDGLDEGQGTDYDQVTINQRKLGDYLITVIPEPGALPTDTYSLFTTFGATTTALVEDILISDIPGQPYIIRSTETAIEKVIPASIEIKRDDVRLGGGGTLGVFVTIDKGFGVGVKEIDPSMISFEGASPERAKIARDTLKLKFRTRAMIDAPIGENVELMLTGELFDGTKVEGSDVVNVRP